MPRTNDDGFSDQLSPGGHPPDRNLEVAERDARIIEDAVKGMRVFELCEKYGLSKEQMSRILKAAATRTRERTAEIVEQRFMLQEQRLERLYRIVELELQAYEQYMMALHALHGKLPDSIKPQEFNDKPFRVAVMIMDRQAKLLGLDRGGMANRDKSPTMWLDDAPIEQVVDYAKQLKMTLPTQFET